MKKYTKGTSMPKNEPASHFRYWIARGLGGLNAKHPIVHGSVATR